MPGVPKSTGSAVAGYFTRIIDACSGLKNQPLVIAFSGGGDSLALLALACEYASPQQVIALIVDHGLRNESAQDARQAADTATALGVDARILRWDNPRSGQGHARKARYSLLAKACRELGAQTLFLAHTRDDQEETFVIRLSRGSMARGLAAMCTQAPFPLWPEGRGLCLARPLLGVTREELRHYLQAKKLDWIEDPSNQDRRYARVRARQRLTSLHQTALGKGRIARSVTLLGVLENQKREQARALLTTMVQWHPAGFALVCHNRLAMAEPVIAQVTLAAIMAAIAGNGGTPPMPGNTVRRVIIRLGIEKGPGFCVAGCRLARTGAQVLVSRDPGAMLGRTPDRKKLSEPVYKGQMILFDNRFEIMPERDGWVEALGLRAKTLPRSQRDALYALSSAARPLVPVVRDKDGGLCSPLLGGKGSSRFLGVEIVTRFLAPFSHCKG